MELKPIHITLIYIFFHSFVCAQEIHFSQIRNNPVFINPANTGVFNGKARLGASYRSQGRSISVPYITFSGWGDFKMDLDSRNSTALGLGMLLYSDNAGEGSLRTTALYLNGALIKGFNRQNTIRASLGFSIGMINKAVDITKLVFDNQWNGTIFDPNTTNGESLDQNAVLAPVFGIGGLICWDVNEKINSQFGISLGHINKPNLTFYESEYRLQHKLTFHGQAGMRIGEFMLLNPAVYFALKQFSNELLLGANVEFIKDNKKFITGLWYRHERDIIPHIGFYVNEFLLEMSYDINISKLHIASNYRGGFEISIIKQLNLNKKFPGCNAF